MEQVIHITKEAIEHGKLGDGFYVKVGEDGAVLISKESVRDGWEESFRKMHEAEDDKIMFEDDLGDIKDWTW